MSYSAAPARDRCVHVRNAHIGASTVDRPSALQRHSRSICTGHTQRHSICLVCLVPDHAPPLAHFLAASVTPYLPLRLVDRQARVRRMSGDNGHTRLLWYGDSAARTRRSRTQRKQVGCDTVHHVFHEVRERGRSYQARGSETCCGALCETHRSLIIASASR